MHTRLSPVIQDDEIDNPPAKGRAINPFRRFLLVSDIFDFRPMTLFLNPLKNTKNI